MDREIRIIIAGIAVLLFGVISLVMISGDGDESFDEKESGNFQEKSNLADYIDTSSWLVYESEEFLFEMKYPFDWEFNLTDGTVFHPENCVRDKNDNCVGRVRIAVFPQQAEEGVDVYLKDKCEGSEKVALRYVSSEVWMCESRLSSEFLSKNNFDRKKEYFFNDRQGKIIQADIMFRSGEDVSIEEEMIQTIKMQSKN